MVALRKMKSVQKLGKNKNKNRDSWWGELFMAHSVITGIVTVTPKWVTG